MNNETCVILPVYNENIHTLKNLLNQIYTNLPNTYIIIIDDSSNSQNRKSELQSYFPDQKNLHILARKKKLGRGNAVLTGIKHSLSQTDSDYIFEMDSDYSHNPNELTKFIKKIKSDKKIDVVIGSRYLKKSKIHNWPAYRLILSKAINLFLKMLLNIQITDYTNGFRLYTSHSLKYLISKKPLETGFIQLSETAYILKRGGYNIKEIPITFTDRKQGKSSVKFYDLLDSLASAVKIRMRY